MARELYAAIDRRFGWTSALPPEELATRLLFQRKRFEDIPVEPASVDVIVSNDVLEHVDVPAVFSRSYELLKPGGLFVASVDLAGHNAFSDREHPLDFLTCPDWLWDMMHSHIVTTNRVRLPDFTRFAKVAGFEIIAVEELAQATSEHVAEIRPYLNPRYRGLSDAELAPTQCNLVLRKPAEREALSASLLESGERVAARAVVDEQPLVAEAEAARSVG